PHTGDNRDRDVGSRFLPSGGLLLPTGWPVNPFRGKTTDRRAGCGKSARPVRREGERQSRSPYPYLFVFISKTEREILRFAQNDMLGELWPYLRGACSRVGATHARFIPMASALSVPSSQLFRSRSIKASPPSSCQISFPTPHI